MTENPEPKFCCSLWLYYIRFPKTVVNKMKIKMTKFLNASCRRAHLPVEDIALAGSARCHHLPVGDIAFMCQSQRSCGHRGQCRR